MTPHLGPILFVPGSWKFWLNLCHVSPPTAPLFSQQMSLILYIYLKHKKQTNSNYCRWSSPKWEVLLIKYSSTLLLSLWIYLATTSNVTLFLFLFWLFYFLLIYWKHLCYHLYIFKSHYLYIILIYLYIYIFILFVCILI